MRFGEYTLESFRPKKVTESTELKIFPNPASDYVNISLPFQLNKPLDIYFINLNTGQTELMTLPLNGKVDIQKLEKGIYLVQVKYYNKTYKGKLLVQ